MLCEAIENKIPAYQESQLPPAERAAVEDHLAHCAACRLFAQQFQQLDAVLSAGIKIPALSSDFDRQLNERIKALSISSSEAQRAARKRQLQEEFEAGLRQIQRGAFAPRNLLNTLASFLMACLAGSFAWLLTKSLTAQLTAQSLGGFEPALLPWLALGLAFMAFSLREAFTRSGAS